MATNLQDSFLAERMRLESPVAVALMNAAVVHGIVKGFDSFTVLIEAEAKTQLIYKHAIATIS